MSAGRRLRGDFLVRRDSILAMESGLTSALDEALARMDVGADVSVTWLRSEHPEHADAVLEALSVQRALAGRDDGPTRAGAYRIVELLGRGGMGSVYRARALDPAVRPGVAAIKVMRPSIAADQRAVARFRREIRAGRRVRHPNVVWTLAGGVDRSAVPPRWYIVLEYVEGESLGAVLDRSGPLPLETARRVLLDAARGLSAIHDMGLVHRDVKPENLILTRDGAVKVADLGVAAATEGRAGAADGDAFAGSPRYAAPEQFLAHAQSLDGRADLFALGRTMFELLTGTHPSEADAVRRGVRASDLRPGVGPLLDEIVAALMEPDRRHRPRSAADVVRIVGEGDGSSWLARRLALRRVPADSPLRRMLRTEDAGFVDRDAAVGVVSDAWKDACAGRGGAVFVTGAAGAGKSRLVAEICIASVADGSGQVLLGGFDPTGVDLTFGAFRAALVRHVGDTTPDAALGAACSAWLSGTPALAEPFRRLLQDAAAPDDARLLTRDVLPRVFADAFAGVARTAPTLLVVEDIHFAGKDAYETLRTVAAAARSLRLLVVATSRTEAGRPPGAVSVRLEPISRTGTLSLVRETLGPSRSADRLARRLAEETDGTPHHLRLAVRHLAAEGRIRWRANGTWELRRPNDVLPVPPDVGEAARSALGRLSPADTELVRCAAVVGFAFDPAHVAAIAGCDGESVLHRLRRIGSAHGIVQVEQAAATFEHHQVHKLVYDGVPRAKRRALHTRVAASIERSVLDGGAAMDAVVRDPRAVAICRHHLLGVAPERALPFLHATLQRLTAAGRNPEGLTLARRALRRIPGLTGEPRIRVLLWMSRALVERAAVDAAQAAVEESAALGDDGLRAEALLALAMEVAVSRDPEAGCGLLREAADLARRSGRADVERSSLTALCQIEARLARPESAVANGRRALSIATTDECANVDGLRAVSDVLRFFGHPDESLGPARAAVEAAARCDSVVHAGIAAVTLGSSLCATGKTPEGVVQLRTGADLLRSAGVARREAFAVGMLASGLLGIGLWEDARDAALRAVELGSRLKTAQLAAFHAVFAESCVRTGELDRALVAAESGVRLSRTRSYRLGVGLVHEHRGAVLLALGEHARATRDFEAAGAALAAMGKHGEAARQGANIAQSLQELGRIDAAEARCRDALARQIGTRDASDVQGTRLRLAEILLAAGRHDEASAEISVVLGDAAAQADAEFAFRCRVVAARAAGPGSPAAIDAVRAGLRNASVPSRLVAELALWDLTRNRDHAAAARSALDRLVQGASPRYRESMVRSMATYRRVVEAAREAQLAGA